MPRGLEDAVRAYQLPTPSPGQLFLSQYNLAANQPIYVTPGFGGTGSGPLPPIVTGGAHYSITVSHYCDMSMFESAQGSLPIGPSDIRIKRDIALVDHVRDGVDLYRFRFVGDDQVYVGVLAQKVAHAVPDAVLLGSDGLLQVNYARLGIQLRTWERWIASRWLRPEFRNAT